VKYLLYNRAWQDILMLFVDTEICYFHMPGWQMKKYKFDLTKSGLKNYCLGFIEMDYVFNPFHKIGEVLNNQIQKSHSNSVLTIE